MENMVIIVDEGPTLFHEPALQALQEAAHQEAEVHAVPTRVEAEGAGPQVILPQGHQNLAEQSVCLAVTLRRFGAKRKVDPEDVAAPRQEGDDAPDARMLQVTKSLINAAELRDLDKLDRQIRQYLYDIGLPSPLKRNFYLIPVNMLAEVDQQLQAYSQERDRLVEALVQAWPDLIEEARTRLGRLFNPGDYPAAHTLRGLFSMEVTYMQFGVPTTLQQVPGMYERELQRHQAGWENNYLEVRYTLRELFYQLAEKLAERLEPNAQGEFPIFKSSTVDNMKQFLQTFPGRNLTGDLELATLVESLARQMERIDVRMLRTSPAARRILSGFLRRRVLPEAQRLTQDRWAVPVLPEE